MQTSVKPGDVPLSTPAVKTSDRPARVLAADDQQPILDAIEFLLRPHGYVVDTALSLAGAEALPRTHDTLLIDLNTRDDIWQVAKFVCFQRSSPSTAIFLLSSRRRGATWLWRSKQCGAERRFHQKPWDAIICSASCARK
jgi:CheY-like chemotaxis protein